MNYSRRKLITDNLAGENCEYDRNYLLSLSDEELLNLYQKETLELSQESIYFDNIVK